MYLPLAGSANGKRSDPVGNFPGVVGVEYHPDGVGVEREGVVEEFALCGKTLDDGLLVGQQLNKLLDTGRLQLKGDHKDLAGAVHCG